MQHTGNHMPHRFTTQNIGNLVVIMVSVAFVISRLAMPLIIDGSYTDEYFHITSGISLFESADYAYIYNTGGPYDRGLLMSLWVGLWVALFGKSILVAKLAPISIGIINYFLFLYLSINLLDKKRYQVLLLLLYTLSPWCIFNDFYIRMYIVYEMLLLILLVLGFKMYHAMRDPDWKKVLLFLSLIIILNALNLFADNDTGRYLITAATAVMLGSLFILEFNTAPKRSGGLPGSIAGSVLLSSRTHRAVVVLVISVLALMALDAGNKIEFLLNAQVEYTSSPERKYTWLFWEKNGVITAFFVLGVASFWLKNSGFEIIVFSVTGVLFLIHIASSDDLHIIRGIMYFMPLYYITAVIAASKARYPSAWLWYIIISGMFLGTTVTNVPRGFYTAPRITSEIFYIEYARLYNSVINNCHDNLIIEAAPSSPFIARFYGVNVDYVLSAAGNAEKDDVYTVNKNTGKVKTVWGSTPVLTDISDLTLLDKDVCLIVRIPSKSRFLPPTTNDLLQEAEKKWHFSNIDLYRFKHEALARKN